MKEYKLPFNINPRPIEEEVWVTSSFKYKLEVSNLGRLRWRDTGQILTSKYPYGTIMVGQNVGQITIAKEVAKQFCPNPLGFKHVAYRDGDNTNTMANNLVWKAGKSGMSARTSEYTLKSMLSAHELRLEHNRLVREQEAQRIKEEDESH